jgi:hypothetical protein
MSVKGIPALTQIDNHMIASNGFQCDRNGPGIRARNVLRNAVLDRDDRSIRYRQRFGTITVRSSSGAQAAPVSPRLCIS